MPPLPMPSPPLTRCQGRASLPLLPVIDASKATLLFAVYAGKLACLPRASDNWGCYHLHLNPYHQPHLRTRPYLRWTRLGGTHSTRSRSVDIMILRHATRPDNETASLAYNTRLPLNLPLRRSDRAVFVRNVISIASYVTFRY